MKRKKKNRAARKYFQLCILVILLMLSIVIYQKCFGRPSLSTQNSGTAVQDTQKIAQNDWRLTLVNYEHSIQEGYKPELQAVGRGYQFDARAADALTDMLSAAKADGLDPLICSAYRSTEKQKDLFTKQVKKQKAKGLSEQKAEEKAKTVVAYPGTSEHQLGLAVDIVSAKYQLLDNKQAETREAKWLKQHCAEYGFILRYPVDKKDITKVIFEPWHYRYVGKEAAKYIMEQGICLEEYLEQQSS